MIAEILPWVVGIGGILLMIALCVGGALCMSGSLSEQERRGMGVETPEDHRMTAVRCARCEKLHTRGSLFCCPDCEYMFHLERHSLDLFAGTPARPLSDSDTTTSGSTHWIAPKRSIPRVAVPAPVLRRGKVVR